MIALALPYPFDLHFMQRALIAGVAVGVFAPMIGTFLVQKRMSLIGDGIGHIAFAGVGAGFLAQSGVIAGVALGLARSGRRSCSRWPDRSASSGCGHDAGRPVTSRSRCSSIRASRWGWCW